MLKKMLLLCGLLTAQGFEIVHAQGLSLNTESGLDIGLQASSYNYEEFVEGNPFVSHIGHKWGVVGTWNYAFEGDLNNWYLSLDARYAEGYVDYDGSGTMKGQPDKLSDYRLLVGKDVPFDDFLLSFYSGAGVRSLYNDARGETSTHKFGYRRDSSYVYLPVGLTHRMGLGEGDARLSTTLEYDHLLEGRQVSHVTDAGAQTDLYNSQRKGFGLRLMLAYETEHWTLGSFYNYWNIQRSENGTFIDLPYLWTGYEPLNITREFGLLLKYRFR